MNTLYVLTFEDPGLVLHSANRMGDRGNNSDCSDICLHETFSSHRKSDNVKSFKNQPFI